MTQTTQGTASQGPATTDPNGAAEAVVCINAPDLPRLPQASDEAPAVALKEWLAVDAYRRLQAHEAGDGVLGHAASYQYGLARALHELHGRDPETANALSANILGAWRMGAVEEELDWMLHAIGVDSRLLVTETVVDDRDGICRIPVREARAMIVHTIECYGGGDDRYAEDLSGLVHADLASAGLLATPEREAEIRDSQRLADWLLLTDRARAFDADMPGEGQAYWWAANLLVDPAEVAALRGRVDAATSAGPETASTAVEGQ